MALRGTNQEFGRPYNRRIVLEAIRLHGPITRARLAKQIGLTLQTVSTITAELEEKGFVLLRPGAPRGRGFPAPTLEINPEGGFAVGLNISPFGLEAALVNIAGDIVARDQLEIPHLGPDQGFAAIGRLTRKLTALRPGARVLGVGLALPGPFDVDSMSFVGPTTMEGWRDVPMLERLQAAVDHPAFIDEAATASAHGECLYGVGTSFRDFYYLYLGVGFGGSVVYDGQVVRGAWGNAGEIGHVPLVPDGDLCPCGNRGCLERYISLEAFERRGRELGEQAWAAEVAPLMRAAIVTVENLFDPKIIVLGGPAPRRLIDRLLAAAEPLPNSVAVRRDRTAPRIVASGIGADAALRGAAALAVSGVLSPRFGVLFGPDVEEEETDPMMRTATRRKSA